MADRHITDEEIAQAAGSGPRIPPGVPRATCLKCGNEHVAFYASMACDCRVELTERKTYAEWLEDLRRYGMGVLKEPGDAKFPWDKKINGRQALTFYLQSDLKKVGLSELDDGYYFRDAFADAGFPPELDPISL